MSFDLALLNNDLSIQADGSIKTITDTPKLRQDIIKIILTPLGSVRKHPWYGCSVSEDVIGKNLQSHILDSHIKSSVSQALERLRTLQIQQSSTQKVSLAEMIQAIGDVHAERDIDDLRRVNIVVTVLTKRMTKVDELFTLMA